MINAFCFFKVWYRFVWLVGCYLSFGSFSVCVCSLAKMPEKKVFESVRKATSESDLKLTGDKVSQHCKVCSFNRSNEEIVYYKHFSMRTLFYPVLCKLQNCNLSFSCRNWSRGTPNKRPCTHNNSFSSIFLRRLNWKLDLPEKTAGRLPNVPCFLWARPDRFPRYLCWLSTIKCVWIYS